MIIYPNGDDSIEGNDYISVYLPITNTSSLPAGWEANVVFSFFLFFNQLCDNYLVIHGQVRRFHKIKSQWGCSKFISHKSLKESSNGYLVDDNCILGAEFSKLGEQCFSKEFTVGNHKWKIQLYPNGNGCQRDQSISIFLVSVDATGFDCRKSVKAKYTISIKDQINGAHRETIAGSNWFSAVNSKWGRRACMPAT
ncbi:hypothetical protein RND71_039818 [Anisodus tanguticus]|uniref:MATH domain-containing protein n=1 Tax=Anisodus tanguticus TaxID=243964 RepID=A0AAE1USC1_9SOLA|nr:hypothetical protein RND71_039818 [Anisodus tanguticus]